jgi:hypothetical protein
MCTTSVSTTPIRNLTKLNFTLHYNNYNYNYYNNNRIIVVIIQIINSLPTRIVVVEFFNVDDYKTQPGQVKKVFTRRCTELNTPSNIVPLDDPPNIVHVTYGTPEAALAAIEHLDKFDFKFKGVSIRARSLAEGVCSTRAGCAARERLSVIWLMLTCCDVAETSTLDLPQSFILGH